MFLRVGAPSSGADEGEPQVGIREQQPQAHSVKGSRCREGGGLEPSGNILLTAESATIPARSPRLVGVLVASFLYAQPLSPFPTPTPFLFFIPAHPIPRQQIQQHYNYQSKAPRQANKKKSKEGYRGLLTASSGDKYPCGSDSM